MNRREIENEINNKKNIEEALPNALNMMSSDYYAYTMMTFAMNYYNYYELTTQSDCEEADTLFRQVNRLTIEAILKPFDGQVRENALKHIDAIRSLIMELMKSLTAYADRFAIYEYILNRLEKNFEESLVEVEDDVAAKEILKAVFSDKDQMLINSRIRLMLSQLPVRMTKRKFLDML